MGYEYAGYSLYDENHQFLGKGTGTPASFGKLFLDAMIPALEAMTASKASGGDAKAVFVAGVAAARAGVEYTKTIAATKGRASYIGDRSIGHQDPGATSFTFLLESIADCV